MSNFANDLKPALTFATGLTAVACGNELLSRARAQREKDADTSQRTYWYAAAAGFIGLVLAYRGAQMFSE